ncbi:30S ribosomal protein S6 [Candidatus Gottesmanbacteria bacterium]|nr:30S ribosomal protein S6 [Candidatus Gottesmanbacteria bacterium]
MRIYELMLIIRPEVEVSEKKAEDIVKKIVEKVGGKLASVTVWGKKALAFPIRKTTEGTYLLATVEADGLKSADLEKQVRMGSDILRFLLTVK